MNNTQRTIYKKESLPRSKRNPASGFTLFVAIVIMGTLLLITTGITSLAFKESLLASSGKESQYAFYAADSGAECALYWDVKNPSGFSAFSASTTSTITCNRDSDSYNQTHNIYDVGGTNQSIFWVYFSPDSRCAEVRVNKLPNGSTTIESYGYNTCDNSNPRRVQRAVKASY